MRKVFNNTLAFLLFTNIGYACCLVALQIETIIALSIRFNNLFFVLASALATILYYSIRYLYISITETSNNKRLQWIIYHKKWIVIQVKISALLLILLVIYNIPLLLQLSLINWIIVLFFPLLGCLYFSSLFIKNKLLNIRSLGLLKPFIVGIVWSGLATFYPIIFSIYSYDNPYFFSYEKVWLHFLQNTIYISLLSIIYDIKDIESDSVANISTWPVCFGVTATIYYIIFPVTLAAAASALLYNYNHTTVTSIINIIPFILLLIVAHSLRKTKGIVYYLAIIDGLMIIKAFSGIISIIFK